VPSYPKNIWIIVITASLCTTAAPFFMLAGALMGAVLAPKPEWATVPIAALILGSSSMMVPAIFTLRTLGRKMGTMLGIGLLITSAFVCAYAAARASFSILVAGSILLGCGMAFLQQLRFAVIESLDKQSAIPGALSLLVLSGAFAAFLGPELALLGTKLFSQNTQDPTAMYTGSYLLLALVNVVAFIVFTQFKNPVIQQESPEKQEPRSILEIAKSPLFLSAIAAAAAGFGVMSFLMTSTPVTMHQIHGHSIEDAKWVIQSHMLAMFLPSLITGKLINRFGEGKVILSGAVLYIVVLAIAFQGQEVIHFWWALLFLGVGWNFLFIGGTTLLPKSYQHHERFKAQAVNDFSVFSIQALASLSAGWVLFQFGWQAQLLICIPFVLLALALGGFLTFRRTAA